MADKLTNVTDSNFNTEVEQSNLPVLVDFGATWCAPCKSLGSILDGMVDEYSGKVKFCYVDIQQAPFTSQKFAIRSVPTVIMFNKGTPRGSVVGAVDKNKLTELINEAM